MNFFIILTQYSLNNTIFQLKDHLLISNIHGIYTFLLSIVNVFGSSINRILFKYDVLLLILLCL